MKSFRAIFAAPVAVAAMLLAGCTAPPEGVEPVSGFEASRYSGTWYEIMRLDHRFERGLTNVTATYRPNDDGTLSVENRGLNREDCIWDTAEGTAEFLQSPDIASLAVTFFWPFQGGYHVFALDKSGYQWAAISGPNKGYLWILSRDRQLTEPVRDELLKKAGALGFPVEDLIEVPQDPSDCPEQSS